jgi:hypothetical protein
MKNKKRSSRVSKGGTMWSTEVPFDTQFHGDLPKKDIKKHIDEIDKVIIPRLQEDINTEKEENKIKLAKNNDRQTKIEAITLRNSAVYSQINTKWYMFLLTGIFSLFRYIFAAIGSLLYTLIFVVLGQILLLIFSAIKVIFSNPVIIGAILLVVSIILILQFVFGYLVPLPAFASQRPPEKTLEGQTIAEPKIEYEYDFITSMKEFFLSIPQWFDNAFINMTYLYQKLAKFFGNNHMLDVYMKDREEYYDGRWDNIIHMELGSLVQNFDNITPQDKDYIYTIIKPKDLDLHLSSLKEDQHIHLDMKKLPEKFYNNVEKDIDILKFKWDKQDINNNTAVQYVMTCNSYDKNDKPFNLYTDYIENETECEPIKISFKQENIDDTANTPKYYDIQVVRGDKSLQKDAYMQMPL